MESELEQATKIHSDLKSPSPHSRELQNTIDSHKPESPNKTFTRAKREKIFRTLLSSFPEYTFKVGQFSPLGFLVTLVPWESEGSGDFEKKWGGGREEGGVVGTWQRATGNVIFSRLRIKARPCSVKQRAPLKRNILAETVSLKIIFNKHGPL